MRMSAGRIAATGWLLVETATLELLGQPQP
jgi:hypothetical protein